MKTKLTSIFFAFLFIAINLAVPLLPYFSQVASADPTIPPPPHSEIAVGTTGTRCFAVLNPSGRPSDVMQAYSIYDGAGNGLYTAADASSGDAQDTYRKAAQDDAFVTITFWSDEQIYQSACSQLGILFQSQKDTFTFYGYSNNGTTQTFSGDVGTDKTLALNGVSAVKESFTNIAGYNAALFSVGGGAGGGNNNCPDGKFSLAGSGGRDGNLQTQACVNKYASTARFVDAATISFAGGLFKADRWSGNTGGHPTGDSMRYVLSQAPANDPDWTKSSKLAYIDIDTSKSISSTYGSAIDLNISGDSPSSFANNISFARSNIGNQVTAYFTNWNKQNQDGDVPFQNNPAASGNPQISFKVTLAGISVFGRYFPATDKHPASIQPIFTSGDSHEMLYIGNYTKSDPTHPDRFITDGGPGGCDNAAAKPYFDSIPANADKLEKGSLISVPWQLNTSSNCGQFYQASIKLYVMDPNDTPGEINQTGVKCVSDDPKTPTTTAPANDNGSCPKGFHSDGGSSKQTCEQAAGGLGWIMCIIIDKLADAVNGIYTGFIVPMMKVPALTASDTKSATDPTTGADKLKTAWSSFRVFGNIILIIVVLVIVFGESVGGGVLDAYTIKKVLPRLLIAAIGINLSYYIVGGFIDITNIIGNGIRLMITAPFGLDGNDFDLKTVNGATQGGFLGLSAVGVAALIAVADSAAIVGAFIWIIFTLLPMIFFLFIAIMGVLALRIGLIYAAVLVSPVAFALWVLPNTEKYFKKWWELLQSTALVYPIISALFGLSMVLAQTTIWVTGSKGAINGVIGYIISLIIVIMPLVLIPFAFKLAGGILGRAYEFANGARQQGNGWLKKRGEMRKERMAGGRFFSPNSRFGKSGAGTALNSALERNAIRSKNEHDEARGTRFAFSRAGRGRNTTALAALAGDHHGHHADENAKRINDSYGGNEDVTQAAWRAHDRQGRFSESEMSRHLREDYLNDDGTRKYDDAYIASSVARARQMRASMGGSGFLMASSMSYMNNGTVDPTANVEAMQMIVRATHGDKQAAINTMLKVSEIAKAAGRVDQFSSSPTDNIVALGRVEELDHHGGDAYGVEAEQISKFLLEQAKKTRSPGEMAMAKGHAIERFADLGYTDLKAKQERVVVTGEYRTERAAKGAVNEASNNLQAAQGAAQAADRVVKDYQAQVTLSDGTTDAAAQDRLNQAIADRTAAHTAVASAQDNFNVRVREHTTAQNALESLDIHKDLMREHAWSQGIIDLSAQVPEGKVDAYVKDLFSQTIKADVDGSGVLKDITVAAANNNQDVVSNETYRLYHREWGDAQAQRVAGYQAQAQAAQGKPPGSIPPVT